MKIKYQQKIIRALKKEIRRLNVSNIIFSSEHLQSRLKNTGEIRRLKNILEDMGMKDFKVIFYLRNPADLANSLYSTAVKSWNVRISPVPPDNQYYNKICNHRQTILDWGEVFGTDKLDPRLYDKNEFLNGSIFEDLLAAVGAGWSDQYHIPDNMNIKQTGCIMPKGSPSR